MTEYKLDLGEDGEIYIVSAETESGIREAGIGDTVREISEQILLRPMRGLGKLFATVLPPFNNDEFQLDEYSIEFALGIGTEAGVDAPFVTAKVMPEGNFKCTYTWKRKPSDHSSASTNAS